jgi:hypothetical protein
MNPAIRGKQIGFARSAASDQTRWFRSKSASAEAFLAARGGACGSDCEEVTGGVDRVGRAVVDGVPTRRYRGKIGVADSVKRLREEGAETVASLVEKHGTPTAVEAWIDAKGLVRRVRIVQTRPGEDGKGSTTTDMRMDFFDFGAEPEIDVPDSDEVFDATSVTQEQLEASGNE